MRVRPGVVGVIVVAALAGIAGRTSAAVASPADAAEPLVQEGIAFRSAFRDAEALEKFQRAYDIAKTPRIEAQIGAAEQALGRWVDAETHIVHALAAATDGWIIKNRPTLEKALGAVRSHIGTLEILGKPAGAEIRIEGDVVGRLPLAAPLHMPAGRTTIELRASGYFTVTRVVTVEAEKATRETVVLRPDEGAATGAVAVGPSASGDANDRRPPAAIGATTQRLDQASAHQSEAGVVSQAQPENGPSASTATFGTAWRRPTELVVAGLAAVGLVLGAVEHIKWQDKVDTFEHMDTCGRTEVNRGGLGCEQLYSDGHSTRNLAFISYGAAVALGATAAILYFTEPSHDSSNHAFICGPATLRKGVECVLRF